MSAQPCARTLRDACNGQTIRRTRLMRYIGPDGLVDGEDVFLELHFETNKVVRLASGPNGETLRVDWDEWNDPFAEPLSPENRQFVMESGKWTAFDMSDMSPYSAFMGKRIERVEAVQNKFGTFAGVVLSNSTGRIVFYVDCDEGFITFDTEDSKFVSRGFSIHLIDGVDY